MASKYKPLTINLLKDNVDDVRERVSEVTDILFFFAFSLGGNTGDLRTILDILADHLARNYKQDIFL